MKHRYGWKPDVPDQRDYRYKRGFKLFLPQKVDLRSFCSAVEDQGSLGSCTAQALAGNVELLDRKIDGEYIDVSRLFIYYNERAIEGTVNEDSGAYIRNGIKSLDRWGVCSEKLLPYDISQFTKKPNNECYIDAIYKRISIYARLSGVADMLACLADGYPVVFGIGVYESFETPEVAKTGIVPMPADNEVLLGGHAVLAVGYDMAEKVFIVRNSWGEGWGQKGYFTLPFKYVEKLGSDFWTIRK
ncbi:MAG: C1 family peptidase [Candidatus Omnitrophota bacterium]